MNLVSPFNMGETVKDTISGYTGIVVAITHYMTQCTHLSLQGPMKKDGSVPDWENFDETRCKMMKKAPVVKLAPPLTEGSVRGGPAPKVPQQ